ncbi:MAG: hypothetical protein HIU88_12650 [Acidobacteria bacterium]|nr:hypothetical protein [Acidobacteriota bacterium]
MRTVHNPIDADTYKDFIQVDLGDPATPEQALLLDLALGDQNTPGSNRAWTRWIDGWTLKETFSFGAGTPAQQGTLRATLGDRYLMGTALDLHDMAATMRAELRSRTDLPRKGYRITVNTTGINWGINVWVDSGNLTRGEAADVWTAARQIAAGHEFRCTRTANDADYLVSEYDRLGLRRR